MHTRLYLKIYKLIELQSKIETNLKLTTKINILIIIHLYLKILSISPIGNQIEARILLIEDYHSSAQETIPNS